MDNLKGGGGERAGLLPVVLASAVFVLVALGFVMVASASHNVQSPPWAASCFFLRKQAGWLALGLATFLVAAWVPYRFWRWSAPLLWLVAVALLVLVLVEGRKIGGSQRWLFGFQPSEPGKFAMVAFLAFWISAVPLKMDRWREGILWPGGAIAVFLVLLLLEPDLGAAIHLTLVCGAMLFLGGISLRRVFWVGLLSGACLFGYLRMDEVRWARVLAYFHPEEHPEVAHQAIQSQSAFIAGGAGFNLGGGVQKQFYLPEIHTDFIYANVGEELGIAGSLGVATLFLVFFFCGLAASWRAPDNFGRSFAFGLTLLLVSQAFFNMYVVTDLLPTKGIALPFFSYGGSNLLISLLISGILLNIARSRDGSIR